MKINIFECVVEHQNQVIQLEQSCFLDEAWLPSMIESTLHSTVKKIIVLTQGNTAIGYCILQLIDGEGEIERIGILPDYRKQGYGKYLLDKILKKYSLEKCILDVKESNKNAIGLYQHCGFEMIARREDYYFDGSAALIMEWKLKTNDIIK